MGNSTSYELSDFRKKKLLHEFETFYDFDKNGELDWNDFNHAREHICKLSGWSPSSGDYVKTQCVFVEIWRCLQKKADTDLDEKITKEEWVDMWEACGQEQCDENVEAKKEKRAAKCMFPNWLDEYISYKFRLYDRTGDGDIDVEEFAYVLGMFGIKEKAARTAFTLFSEGNTRKVDFPYFKELCLQYYLSDNPDDLGNYITGKLDFEEEDEACHSSKSKSK